MTASPFFRSHTDDDNCGKRGDKRRRNFDGHLFAPSLMPCDQDSKGKLDKTWECSCTANSKEKDSVYLGMFLYYEMTSHYTFSPNNEGWSLEALCYLRTTSCDARKHPLDKLLESRISSGCGLSHLARNPHIG